MKKKDILIISIILFLIVDTTIIFFTMKKKDNKADTKEFKRVIKDETTINDLVFEYDSTIYVKDIIENETDKIIDTSILGEHKMLVETNERNYNINYKIVDTKKPLIIGSNTIKVTKGNNANLVNKMLCGDNHDDKPNCYITGEYDINKIGSYNLVYNAEDSSGNKNSKNFTLKVIEKKSSNSSSSTSKGKTKISEYIKKYKNEKTKIGIDISAWQDTVDFKKVKQDGVEFVMIRIGYGPSSGELKLDKRFNEYIKKAKEQKLDVGLYFYSYANTEDEAIREAKWIVNKLNGQKLELPIAFDWESWSSFNKYNMSFKKLNDVANAFITEIEKNDYQGMLYSSAYYLKHIWKTYDKTWLAYYTNNNDYQGKYDMWQLTSSGKVNGINTAVDIDVLYLK